MKTYTISADLLGALIEAAAHGAEDMSASADDFEHEDMDLCEEWGERANSAWEAVEQARAMMLPLADRVAVVRLLESQS